jgi:hypothetical protein
VLEANVVEKNFQVAKHVKGAKLAKLAKDILAYWAGLVYRGDLCFVVLVMIVLRILISSLIS